MCASEASNRGPISALQEFVQEEGKLFKMPANCSVLQWEYGTRMAGKNLEFRATVAFVLAGLPHHVAGVWMPSKKKAQRDAAERAIGLYMASGRGGPVFDVIKQLEKGPSSGRSTPRTEEDGWATPSRSASVSSTPKTAPCVGWATPVRAASSCWADWSDLELDPEDGMQTEVDILRDHCLQKGSPPPVCSRKFDEADGTCQAFVEIKLQGVSHTFSGQRCADEGMAEVDVAKRVLWYLQAPGLEDAFEPDWDFARAVAQEIPEPATTRWAKDNRDDETEVQIAEQVAERKTTVMRVQNRLQQLFAKQIETGSTVWHWSYMRDKRDKQWPPRYRAVVRVPLVSQSFSSDWIRGQKEAQIDACEKLLEFLEAQFPK